VKLKKSAETTAAENRDFLFAHMYMSTFVCYSNLATVKTNYKRALKARSCFAAAIDVESDWMMLIVAFLSCISCSVYVHKAYLDGGRRFVISRLVIFVIRYPLFVISD